MSSVALNNVPRSMPAWQGAEEIAQSIDHASLRAHAQELVDLVLTDDTVYLDLLPDSVETEIVTPLTILASALDEPCDPLELVVAARVVTSSMSNVLDDCPPLLRELLLRLPQ